MGISSHSHMGLGAQARLKESLAHYSASHRHPDNIRLHLICVPLIFTATLILVWRLLGGQGMSSEPGAGLWMLPGGLLTLAALGFYARLSWRASLVMLVWSLISLAAMFAMLGLRWPVVPLMVAIFLLAWVGQIIGHRLEGRKPVFLDDLRQLLIGPLFVLVELFPDLRDWLLASKSSSDDA